MLLKIYPDNPNLKFILQAVDVLKKGGVIIYPTDSVYAFACSLDSKSGLEKIAKLREIKVEKANFSLICSDLSHLTDFAKQVDTPIYRIIKKALPGPYTFIFKSSNNVPKYFKGNKKTVGIRIPDNNIVKTLVEELGNPLISASLKDKDEIIEYTTDPELIHERYSDRVDLVIDGGYGNNFPTTVVDCSNNEINIIREGLGDVSNLL